MGYDIVYLIAIKIRKFFKVDAKHCHQLHYRHLSILYFLVISLQQPLNHILITVQHRTANSLNSCNIQHRDCKDHNIHGGYAHFMQDKIQVY